ncbi:MAG: DUF4465 domain-containing protein [Prevotella sp.]|nr:DUF4465 domain-containing protein [Prevotella sp.]MBD9261983.1 DUF4465 domain-containing protein [Prevotella sp.]
MKKIFVSLLMAMPLVASAQTSFTVESNGKKYAFPLEGTTITVTDDKITLPAEAPVYKSNLKSVSLFGMATSFQLKGMSLIADYMWAGKLMPKANNTFKFQATTNTGSDLYFGPEGDANAPIAVSGTATKGSTKFYTIESGYQQDSVLVVFYERTAQYSVMGLVKEAPYYTIDFEGSKWSALIDTPEYGGPLLYGADGGGFYTDEGVYEWTDEATSLHSKLNNAYGSWAYWSGGAAVSNYHCDIANGSSNTQLSLPTETPAHSGDNFIVTYGYSDGSQFATDSRPVFDFQDGVARQVKGLWITNNSYFLHSLTQGDGFNQSATDDTFIDVTFEGFDAAGISQGMVKYRIQDGKKALTDWAYVDLSSLGKINTLKINYEFSKDQDNGYGFAAPAYLVIDDIEIYK